MISPRWFIAKCLLSPVAHDSHGATVTMSRLRREVILTPRHAGDTFRDVDAPQRVMPAPYALRLATRRLYSRMSRDMSFTAMSLRHYLRASLLCRSAPCVWE